MKIFHFILGKANKNRPNGVNQVIAGICKYSSLNGENIKVIGLASNAKFEGEIEERDGFDVIVFSRWSLKLIEELKENLEWCDIVHIHGVYNWPNIIVGKLAKRYSVPYVVTLHNGLAPKLANFRKKIFDFVVQKQYLEDASALHILALEESTEILEVCTPKSFIYAPNGIDIEDFPSQENGNKEHSSNVNDLTIIIGYLGRISEEKNLLNLVKAIEMFEGNTDIVFKIAGPKSGYLDKILSYNPNINIDWVGPQYGDDKVTFIKSLDLFVHPSEADVFSIAAMEVLAVGTPLLITRTSKAAHFYSSNAFFMCEPSQFGIHLGIYSAIEKRNEWESIANNGKALVAATFNWNTASLSLIQGYKELI